MKKRLDITGADLQTDQRLKLIALWQANQRPESAEDQDDHLLVGVVLVALLFLGLAVIAVKWNAL